MPISDSLYANSRTPDIGKSAGLGWLLAIKSGDVEISGGDRKLIYESTDISYNYYQDINKQTLLTTNSQYNIGEIKDKLQSYKFQFNIVDGIHQFSVFERTK